jgi:type I restriction enzyme S subunit
MVGSATEREIQRFSIARGDVLITKDSEDPTDIGIGALVVDAMDRVVCGYHLAIIRPHTESLDSEYLWHFLRTRKVKKYFQQMANGVTRYGLSTEAILGLDVGVPPIELQRDIARRLSDCWKARMMLDTRLSSARALKHQLATTLLAR